MKRRKRTLTTLLTLVMMLAFAGCGVAEQESIFQSLQEEATAAIRADMEKKEVEEGAVGETQAEPESYEDEKNPESFKTDYYNGYFSVQTDSKREDFLLEEEVDKHWLAVFIPKEELEKVWFKEYTSLEEAYAAVDELNTFLDEWEANHHDEIVFDFIKHPRWIESYPQVALEYGVALNPENQIVLSSENLELYLRHIQQRYQDLPGSEQQEKFVNAVRKFFGDNDWMFFEHREVAKRFGFSRDDWGFWRSYIESLNDRQREKFFKYRHPEMADDFPDIAEKYLSE